MNLFKDAEGNLSSTRVMLVILFVNVLVIMNIKVFTLPDFPPGIERFLSWVLGIIFTGGVLKTGAEALKKK
jgi:energy-converting hydrogenase Eha subunit A